MHSKYIPKEASICIVFTTSVTVKYGRKATTGGHKPNGENINYIRGFRSKYFLATATGRMCQDKQFSIILDVSKRMGLIVCRMCVYCIEMMLPRQGGGGGVVASTQSQPHHHHWTQGFWRDVPVCATAPVLL